jgi:hypothetical protein
MATTEGEHIERSGPSSPAAAGASAWPAELQSVFERAVTVEYASLTATDAPITVPVTPYASDDRATLDVSTGVTYPAKAERARRNPKVSLLFADSLGPDPERKPAALVQGLASVRDADLQGNTDRYVRSSIEKFPEVYARQPNWLLRRQAWYFARIWIQVTPVRILWWPDGRTDLPPREWTAPHRPDAPLSDPPPAGGSYRAGAESSTRVSPSTGARGGRHARSDWRAEAATAAAFAMHDVTVVDPDGFPLVAPVRDLEQTAGGFRFRVGAGIALPSAGPACLTAHTHDVPFTSQQNRTFVGHVISRGDGTAEIEVERLLAHWSIPAGRLSAALDFMRRGRELRSRLRVACARRGQEPPKVRLPESTRAG